MTALTFSKPTETGACCATHGCVARGRHYPLMAGHKDTETMLCGACMKRWKKMWEDAGASYGRAEK